MDKIVWQLDADTSRVGVQMDKAVASVNRGTSLMGTGFGNATRSSDRFLESNNRVTNQVAGFTRSLAGARNAADILSAGLDRLENSTNLSLGKGIFLAGSAVAVQQIQQLRAEYEKLNTEVKKLLEPSLSAQTRTGSAIQENITRVVTQLDRLKKEAQGGMWQNIKDAFGENLFTEGGEMLPDSGKADRRRKTDIAALQAKEAELSAGALSKRREQSNLKEAALGGAPSQEIEAAQILIKAKEMVVTSFAELAQNITEVNLKFQELAKTVNDRKMERAGVTLAEAANLPDVVDNSVSYERWKASQDAKRAIGLKGQGEAARLNMNPEAANDLFSQSGEAAEGITGLKPSEKMSADFKGALAVTEEQLKVIAENTAGKLVNK